jgi:hypothetical protein
VFFSSPIQFSSHDHSISEYRFKNPSSFGRKYLSLQLGELLLKGAEFFGVVFDVFEENLFALMLSEGDCGFHGVFAGGGDRFFDAATNIAPSAKVTCPTIPVWPPMITYRPEGEEIQACIALFKIRNPHARWIAFVICVPFFPFCKLI